MDTSTGNTLLVSRAILGVASVTGLSVATSVFPGTFSGNYSATADVLCWGEASQGQVLSILSSSKPTCVNQCLSGTSSS
jgi:hypothetical protein